MTSEEQLYLEWFNDFLTIERFAEYHCIPIEEAKRVIEQGRKDHYARTKG